MRTLKPIAVIISLGIFLVAASPVYACSCLETAPCESYANADVAFLGEVTGSKHPQVFDESEIAVTKRNPPKRVTYEAGAIYFKVVESFRGVSNATEITIHSTLGGGDCGAMFQKGQRYVIFARKEGVVKDVDDSFHKYRMQSLSLKPDPERLWTSICSGNRELATAGDALSYLRNLPKPGYGGTIEGKIYEEIDDYSKEDPPVGAKPYRGASVSAVPVNPKQNEVTGTTDERGNFRLIVPPGKYKVVPVLPKTLIASFDRYSSQHEFSVEDTRCVFMSVTVGNNSELAGKVMDQSGKIASGFSLDMIAVSKGSEGRGFDSRKWAFVDEDEGFRFEELPPGDYLLALNYGDKPDDETPYPTWFYPGTINRAEAKVITIGMGTRIRDLEFRLPAKLAKRGIQGIVVWKDGTPAAGAEVQLADIDSGKDMFFKAPFADATGRFKLESFAGRRYKIRVIIWEKKPDGSGVGIADAESDEFVLNETTPPFRIVLETIDPRRKTIIQTTVRTN